MKRISFGIIFIVLIMAPSRTPQARVTGECYNCHTMHNSQNGQAMATYGSSNPEGAGTGTREYLLRGTCFGCHAQMGGEYIVTIGSVPQVYHNNASRDLAGGNFAYITGHKGSAASDTKGHNVIQLNNNDDTLSTPPGDQHGTGVTNTNLTCAGVYGCHGNRSTSGNYAAMKGAHHTDDGTINGNTTGTSFRFLKGVLGLEYNDSDYPWQDYDKDHHNEYKGATSMGTSSKTAPVNGTISGLCAECHGYYHGIGSNECTSAWPWYRHPTDTSLPVIAGSKQEYAAYTTYSIVAPVARTAIPGSPSGTVDPSDSDDDIVMCLSCHRAHASSNFKIMRWDYKSTTLSTALSGCGVCHTSKKPGSGEPYGDSAHAASYGVDRNTSGFPNYKVGNCAHCHEQHASIDGNEPYPTGGPDSFLLFRTHFGTQLNMFCYSCHGDQNQVQTLPPQYNYSRMAGGDTNTCPTHIMEAFEFEDNSGESRSNCGAVPVVNRDWPSAHFLKDIRNFLNSKASWKYFGTAKINPCSGCHNPHKAQRDPHTPTGRIEGGKLKSSVSRPSQHSPWHNWELWGDDSTERMDKYNYQPPYRYNSTTEYEPDGHTTSGGDASRTVDYVTFCLDCHQYSIGGLSAIDWSSSGDIHGAASQCVCDYGDKTPPYTEGTNYVLSCLDCHEPHGSPNDYLLRQEINGTQVPYITDFGRWWYVCNACHTNLHDWPNPGSWTKHFGGIMQIVPSSGCSSCHSHGYTYPAGSLSRCSGCGSSVKTF